MLPLLPGDLLAAAQVLLGTPRRLRRDLARRLVAEAAAARDHAQRTGHPHPVWGAGSLAEAAFAHRPWPVPAVLDADALGCLMLVLRAVQPVVHKKSGRGALSG